MTMKELEVVPLCGNDAFLRQVPEAILVTESNPEMITKDEWRTLNALCVRSIAFDVMICQTYSMEIS